MLANGSVPMLAAAASPDARLAAGGDMLDRRNLAVSSPAVTTNGNDEAGNSAALQIAELQRSQERGSSPIPSSLSSSAVIATHHRSATKRPPIGQHGLHDESAVSTCTVPPGVETSGRTESNNPSTTPRLHDQGGQHHRQHHQLRTAYIGSESLSASSAVLDTMLSPPAEVGTDRLSTATKTSSIDRASPPPPDAYPPATVARPTTPNYQRDIPRIPASYCPGPVSITAYANSDADLRALRGVESTNPLTSGNPASILAHSAAIGHEGRIALHIEEQYHHQHRHHYHAAPTALAGYPRQGSPMPTAGPPAEYFRHSAPGNMEMEEAGETDSLGSRSGKRYEDGHNNGWNAMHIEVDRSMRDDFPRAYEGNIQGPVLKEPPLGEGWDEHGNDISKIANEAVRKAECEAWVAMLQREAADIRSGDHPEVLRRSVLTVKASKRRLEMTEKNARRQKNTVERLYSMELKGIQASYEATIEQTRERLMGEVNEEIRRSKSRLEGFKEVENRMNTRHTRGNAKGAIEDPWLVTTGAKSNSNSKRPLCHVALLLDEDDAVEDIEYLRYGGHGPNSGGNGGDARSGGRGGGGDGRGGSGGGYGGYADHPSSSGSGRTRRPPAWRRDE